MIGEQASWAWVGHCKTPAGLGHVQVFHWKFDFAFFQPRKFEFTFFRMRKFEYADQVWTSLGPNKKFTLVPVIYPRGPWSLQFQVGFHKNILDLCCQHKYCKILQNLLLDWILFSTICADMPILSQYSKHRYETKHCDTWYMICETSYVIHDTCDM